MANNAYKTYNKIYKYNTYHGLKNVLLFAVLSFLEDGFKQQCIFFQPYKTYKTYKTYITYKTYK